MKHFDRATKIVATIGPASRSPEVLEKMIDAGLNVVRMNFSHGSKEDHRETYNMVRELAKRKGVAIGILQDLQGPKIRVARFVNGAVTLHAGDPFIITMDDVDGDETRVGTTYKGLIGDVKPGMNLLLDDGNMALRVEGVSGNDVHTTVVVGGVLKNNKGINVPEADLAVPALSDKDVEDMEFGAELGVDWVALSFVRSRDDLLLARHYLARFGSTAKLMAKIEKPQAVDRFDDILREVDGIMVARGDLGVEMRPEQVPTIQKRLIRLCREAGKPVITATQMLESMISLPRPTRAEASRRGQRHLRRHRRGDAVGRVGGRPLPGGIGRHDGPHCPRGREQRGLQRDARQQHRHQLAARRHRPVGLQHRRAPGRGGHRQLHQDRRRGGAGCQEPSASGGAGPDPQRADPRQLALSWGVVPMLSEDPRDTDDMVRIANTELLKSKLADEGDRYVITAGVPFGMQGTTNMVRVETLKH